MPERDVDMHSGRRSLRLSNHPSVGLMTANAVASRKHRQWTQCLQGRRQAFELFALMMYLLPLRRDQALLQSGQACMQEANLPHWAEIRDGRLTTPPGLLRQTQAGMDGTGEAGVELIEVLFDSVQGRPRVFEHPALLTSLQSGPQRLQTMLHAALEPMRYRL